MSLKRHNTSSPEPEDSPDTKRLRSISPAYDESEEDVVDEHPHVDPASGQTSAFPGLNHHHTEMFYGPASDGIDYLRMVRSEARGVPLVLREEQGELGNPTEEEACAAWFHDGAYTSMPLSSEERQIPLPQEHYYYALLEEFAQLQDSLRRKPPLVEIAKLTDIQLISFPANSSKARQKWENMVLATDPSPVQVASMEVADVLEVIQLFGRKINEWLRPRGNDRIRRLGVWYWAMIGRCPPPGELACEQMAEIRLFGQKAVQYLRTWSDEVEQLNRNQDQPYAYDVKSDTGHGEELLDNRLSRSKGLDIMLDMVVTVIGEVYGQRDLLEQRLVWPGESHGIPYGPQIDSGE